MSTVKPGFQRLFLFLELPAQGTRTRNLEEDVDVGKGEGQAARGIDTIRFGTPQQEAVASSLDPTCLPQGK